MALLRKAHFHSVDIYRLMKNHSRKKKSRRKTDSNFNFFQAVKCSKGFKKKECSAYYSLYTKEHNIK